MNHAIKTEELAIEQGVADGIEECIHNFLTDLGFRNERISQLECRRRDGFIPHSHNLGGLKAIAFGSQDYFYGEGTGFKNADATLEKYWEFDFETVQKENKFPKNYGDWTDEQCEVLYEYRSNCEESDILFSTDCMLTGLERGVFTLNIRMCVCVKDAPYHRQYDDLIEFNITFKHCKSLREKLNKLLKNKDVKMFSSNLSETY